jgi:hypothetical protein
VSLVGSLLRSHPCVYRSVATIRFG